MSDIFPTSLMPVPTYFAKDRYLLMRLSVQNAADPNTTVLRVLRRLFLLANHSRCDIIISSYMIKMYPGDLIAPLRAAYLAERKRNPALHGMHAIAGIG